MPPTTARTYADTIQRRTRSPSRAATARVPPPPPAARLSVSHTPGAATVHPAEPSLHLLTTSSTPEDGDHPRPQARGPPGPISSSTPRFTSPSTQGPDRTAARLWPTGNEADRAARGSPADLQQADRTAEKRSAHRTESNRQRPRRAPRSHGTPRESRRRHARATSHRAGTSSRPTSAPPSMPPPLCSSFASQVTLAIAPRAPEESHEARTRGGAARTPPRNVRP
jgi:hypothetical protein